MSLTACVHACLIVALFAVPASQPGAGGHGSPEPIDFDRDVKPIFAKHCLTCHGPDKQKADLRLDRKAGALRGGDSGAAIVPGKSADSLLVKRVSDDNAESRMPPKGPGLSAAELTALRQWIDQGAKWPDDGSANAADWWSLRAVRRPAVPQIRNPKHEIRN